MSRAKVTSKGQVTVPVDVRQALGIKQGDMLAFEMKADYVVVKRVPSLREALEKLEPLLPTEPARFGDDDEAVAAYFTSRDEDDLADHIIVAEAPKTRARTRP